MHIHTIYSISGLFTCETVHILIRSILPHQICQTWQFLRTCTCAEAYLPWLTVKKFNNTIYSINIHATSLVFVYLTLFRAYVWIFAFEYRLRWWQFENFLKLKIIGQFDIPDVWNRTFNNGLYIIINVNFENDRYVTFFFWISRNYKRIAETGVNKNI